MMIKLSDSALAAFPDNVDVPRYNRTTLSPGIVHIGVGNFHRAHQAHYLNALFDQGLDLDWAIIGAGLKPYDQKMRSDLEQQNWLSTIVELDPGGLSAQVQGAMIDYVDIDPDALIEAMTKPEIRIVSLTITEGGYYMDPIDGGFDPDHPDIQQDIANPDQPRTVFGCIIASLEMRRQAGLKPFTILSCDNIPENGDAARETVCGLARAINPDTARWIEDNVAFPNGMVDCITPATSEREYDLVSKTFCIDDQRPVVCEPFRQWVLEDNFPTGRPALERVGVEFVENVAPYELMKLRILNGGHAAIAYPAGLLGIQYVHEAMAHPLVSGFLRTLITREVIATVPSIPGVDFDAYLETVVERFSNPEVGDTIPRLCLDGSNRQPKFILPTLQERLNAGLSFDGLALELALWCRYCAGTDENQQSIRIEDERAELLNERALLAKDNPVRFLEIEGVFGSLSTNQRLVETFSDALGKLWVDGVEKTLQAYIDA